MNRKFVLSSITGSLQVVLISALLFISIPVFIRQFGAEQYGIFSILMIIGNLNLFVNLGLNSTLTKFLSEQGKSIISDQDIIVSLLLLSCLILPITATGLLFKESILLSLFKIPQNSTFPFVKILYSQLLIANVLVLWGQLLSSVLDSLQLVFITNLSQIIYNILYWGGIISVSFLHPTLDYIGYVILSATVIWFVLIVMFVSNYWGRISFTGLPSYFMKSAKKQLAYSIHLFLSGTLSIFFEPLSKVLISQYVGIVYVGYYDIAIKIRNQIWLLTGKIFQPFFPFIAKTDNISQIQIYIKSIERVTSFILIPFITTIILLSQLLITIWIGSGNDFVTVSTICLIFSFSFAIVVIPGYLFLMAKGFPQKTVRLQLLNIVVNAIVFFILLKPVGYYSIIAANSLAIISSFIATLYYQRKILDIKIFLNKIEIFKLILTFLFCFGCGVFVQYFFSNKYFVILTTPAVVFLVSFLCMRQFHLVSFSDLSVFLSPSSRVYKTLSFYLEVQK